MKRLALALLMIASFAFYGCGAGTEIPEDDTGQDLKPPATGPAMGGEKSPAEPKGMDEGMDEESTEPSEQPQQPDQPELPEQSQPETQDTPPETEQTPPE